MESSSVYMCFPCYREFPTLEEVLAHQVTCTAENPLMLPNEAPVASANVSSLPQMAMQTVSVPHIQSQAAVDHSTMLQQKKAQSDVPRVLYQCADCELLFDALSLWQQHRKMGCSVEMEPQSAVETHETRTQALPKEPEPQRPLQTPNDHQQPEEELTGIKMECTGQEPVEQEEVEFAQRDEDMVAQQLEELQERSQEVQETREETLAETSAEESTPTRRRGQKKPKLPSSLLCVECGQSFSMVPELVSHRRTQHGLKDAIHRCTVCGEGFLNTTLFLYHRRHHRTEVEEPKQDLPIITQVSSALLEAPGEGLLLLATAGEGQSLMEVRTVEQSITETPVSQVEVELDSDDHRETEAEEQNAVVEGAEIVVEKTVEMHQEEIMEVVVEKIEEGVEMEKSTAYEVVQGEVDNDTSMAQPSAFLCHQCGSVFTSVDELGKHRRAEHGLDAPLHTCTECGAEFMNTTQFLYHRRVHKNTTVAHRNLTEVKTKLYTAGAPAVATADGGLEAPAKLSREWSRTALPHQCPYCGQGFTRRSRLREHVFKHTGEKLFNCKICKKSFPTPANLLRHSLIHGGSRIYSCPLCEKRFFQATSLKRHMLTHTGGTFERKVRGKGKGQGRTSEGHLHICSECPASFKLESQLKSHRLLHTSHPFPCNVCGEAFTRRKELDLHSLSHQDKEPKTCPQCGSQFLNQTVLDTHLQRCKGELPTNRRYKGQGRGKVGGQLECDMCGHRCVTQDGLDLHRLSHTGQTPLRCPIAPCRRRFASSAALGEHLVAHCCGALGKRNAPRRFTCEFCGKEFAYASTFTVHMRTHTNERPFECAHCNKRFRQLPHLQDHERIHSGERPFTCWVCGKSFSVAARLTEHARVHSGERPYTCSRCPTAFRSRPNLDKHMRLHANDPSDAGAQTGLDDAAAVQTILLVQESASPSSSSSSALGPVVQEGMLVGEEGSSVVFIHPNITVPAISMPSINVPNISVVAGQDVPHTIEVILEETV